ncbi:MAG: DUF4198 domain-containing protein [Pseudomonadota bacterium]
MSRRTKTIEIFLLALVTFGVQTAAHAHYQWLSPNFFVDSREKAWLSFDHTFGDQRFHPDSGPSSYYRWWIVGPDGLRRSFPNMYLGKTKTVGEVELTEPGTYRLEAEEAFMSWTLLKIDGKDVWQPGRRDDFTDSEVVSSRLYFNKSMAYVTLGTETDSVLEMSGDPLEILFSDHPNKARPGGSLGIRVMANGAPLANQEVNIFAEGGSGHDATDVCTTDKQGQCRIRTKTTGRFLLATRRTLDEPQGDGTDGYSHSVTVMFEVRDSSN